MLLSRSKSFILRFIYHHLLSLMATEHILYLPRSDNTEEYVLVSVSSGGSSSLDLKLLATEGESPYIATREIRLYWPCAKH